MHSARNKELSMPTPTDHDPESEAPPRRRLGRGAAIAIVLASVATLAVVIVMMISNPGPIHVQSIPAQPNPTSAGPTAPAAASPSTPVSPLPSAPAPTSTSSTPTTSTPSPTPSTAPSTTQTAGPAVDSQGFVDSARCDSGDRPIAIARTERSTMVVCESADGTLEYQGVRLRDGASLTLDDVTPIPAGFEVRNGGTTYRLSPTELVVLSGEELQSRDPMVEFRVQ
nr:hypothetical protein Mflv_2088 [Mycolicibacterium gilvum PYR-GCK]